MISLALFLNREDANPVQKRDLVELLNGQVHLFN